jgi:hypothetical protein
MPKTGSEGGHVTGHLGVAQATSQCPRAFARFLSVETSACSIQKGAMYPYDNTKKAVEKPMNPNKRDF